MGVYINSNFNPVHDLLHFKIFCQVLLQFRLASKFDLWAIKIYQIKF